MNKANEGGISSEEVLETNISSDSRERIGPLQEGLEEESVEQATSNFFESVQADHTELANLAHELNIPSERAESILESYQEEMSQLGMEVTQEKDSVLGRIRELVLQRSVFLRASLLAFTAEISGCAMVQEYDRIYDYATKSQQMESAEANPKEWEYLRSVVRKEAQELPVEVSHMYKVNEDNQFETENEIREIGDGQNVTIQFVDEKGESRLGRALEIYGVHTHPNKSITPEVLRQAIRKEYTRAETEKFQSSEFFVLPPSILDMYNFGIVDARDEILGDTGKQLNNRVVDKNGVWTYFIDVANDFVRNMVVQEVEQMELLTEELEKKGISYDKEKLKSPFYCLELLGEIAHRDLSSDKVAKLMELWVAHADTSNFQESALIYQNMQFDFVVNPANSRDELEERINEFILLASEMGIKLQYEFFDEKQEK